MNAVAEAKQIKCAACDGHGVVDRGYHDPGECPDCEGSGLVVQYPSGALAKYRGGPFLSGPTMEHHDEQR